MNPYYQPYWLSPDELEHHGVKGMKHGVQNGPPYPLDRGKNGRITETQKKKKQSFLSRFGKKKKTTTTKKKEDDIPRSKKEQEKIRKKVLKSTDPKYIYKYRSLLTDGELQDRINRMDKEKKIKDMIPKEKTNQKKMEEVKKFLQDSAAMAESVSKIYNSYNAVTTVAQSRADRQANRQRQQEEQRRQREEAERRRRQQQNNNNGNR